LIDRLGGPSAVRTAVDKFYVKVGASRSEQAGPSRQGICHIWVIAVCHQVAIMISVVLIISPWCHTRVFCIEGCKALRMHVAKSLIAMTWKAGQRLQKCEHRAGT
jgi:hypothetical protein